MLNNDLFILTNVVTDAQTITADVKLNPAHSIFKGHFPGQPVLPGVCMMQIIKELLEIAFHKPMKLLKASELKFLSMISPMENTTLKAHVEITLADGQLRTAARLTHNATVIFKLKGIFEALITDEQPI